MRLNRPDQLNAGVECGLCHLLVEARRLSSQLEHGAQHGHARHIAPVGVGQQPAVCQREIAHGDFVAKRLAQILRLNGAIGGVQVRLPALVE